MLSRPIFCYFLLLQLSAFILKPGGIAVQIKNFLRLSTLANWKQFHSKIMMLKTLHPQFPSRLSVLLVIFAVTAPLYGIVGFLGKAAASKWAILLGELLMLLPAYLFLHFKQFNMRKIFRLHPVSRRLVILSFGLAVAIYLVFYELDRLLLNLWQTVWQIMPPAFSLLAPENMQAQLEQTLVAHTALDWVLILLAPVLIAGVFEEVLFRGFVQTAFEPHHKIFTALAITAAIFALNHAAPWWLAQIFLLGLVLGWLAWQCDSIIPGAIVHSLNNFFAVLLINFKNETDWLFWEKAKPWLGESHLHPVVWLGAGAALYFGLKLFHRYCEEETEIATFFNSPE